MSVTKTDACDDMMVLRESRDPTPDQDVLLKHHI